jgi:hypothetical protein
MSVRLPGVVLLLVTAACSVHIGTDGGNASSPRPSSPPPRAAAAPAPRPQAAPAPAPAPATKTLGKHARPDTAPAPSPHPVGGSRTGAMALNPTSNATSEAVNVARLQTTQKRQPKACGVYEVAPGVWTKIDCQMYTASTKAVPSLNKRKLKYVAQHKTLWKPMKIVSGQVRATLNKRKKPVAKPTPTGGAGGTTPPAIAAGGANDNDDGAGIVIADNFPNAVDHRSDNLEGPVKSQGPVGSCTAFALSATVDNAAIRAGKATPGQRTEFASPNHIWSGYGVPNMGAAADANLGRSLATMALWDQNNSEACKLANSPSEDCGDDFIPSVKEGSWRSDNALVAKYDKANSQGTLKIAAFEKMATRPPNMNEIVSALASGQDLFAAFLIDGAKWQTGAMKNGVIQDYDDYSGGHAVTMSGYRDTPSGRQFLIHNSWGTGWGDNGYAWVTEKTVQKWLYFSYKVKLSGGVKDPTDDDCAPDELVDATTNQCGLMCEPDGSRPDNGCK